MNERKSFAGITSLLKAQLIEQALRRRALVSEDSGDPIFGTVSEDPAPPRPAEGMRARRSPASIEGSVGDPAASVPEQHCRFDLHPRYQQIQMIHQGAEHLGIPNPYFREHEGIAGAHTRIASRAYLNFANYNYLGLCGDPRVAEAAKRAIEEFGTSVSASRVVSGERAVHAQLEAALADAYGVEGCLSFVSGHATNVTVLGCLFGPRDLVVHDTLIHNSVLQGVQLSGARRMSFPHNDWHALDRLLAEHRRSFERVVVVLEGVYSMDGDVPDLPRFVEVKRRHRCFLMVDEAHSFGVLGRRGLGIREHFGLRGPDVDIWMGTLSKALASCGGYVAGEHALIENLRYGAPGFVYSVGMPPASAAAALCALRVMLDEPQRVGVLQARGRRFLERARAAGIDAGTSAGYAVVPAITGSSIKAGRLAHALFNRGINVQPILYPAVQEKAARLRFFMSCEHDEDDITRTIDSLAQELARQ